MNINWNAEGYASDFSFVPGYGENVMELLTAPAGSLAADFGCGNGTLTAKLREKGYTVTGVDASEEMLSLAEKNHPELKLMKGDITEITLPEPVDVIFSNAVFHWIEPDRQDALARNIYRNLKPGGELVFEMGGKDCAETVHGSMEKIFVRRGLSYRRLKYFPSVSEYTTILERNGLRVTYAIWFERPTPQKGDDGAVEWAKMFDAANYEGLDQKLKDELFSELREVTRPKLCTPEGKWWIDYTRLRIRAVRPV